MKPFISAKKRVVITGGSGFLGHYVVEKFKNAGYRNIFVPKKEVYDLLDIRAVRKLFNNTKPDIIVHLAGKVGGIGLNREKPGELFYENLIIGSQLMDEARKNGVEKFVGIGTICSYPKFTPTPFKERDLWNGYPEETNAPYGLAKKMLLIQAQAYRKQYGLNAIFLMPANLYGPGDNFKRDSSHVIPAIISKCCEAIRKNKKEIVIWGTGKATREFIYVEDCAEAILLATKNYNDPEPVNIGSGFEISISRLAGLIAKLVGFNGRIAWDRSKPDGQPLRHLDISLAKKKFGFIAKTDFCAGLKNTIVWYKDNFTQ